MEHGGILGIRFLYQIEPWGFISQKDVISYPTIQLVSGLLVLVVGGTFPREFWEFQTNQVVWTLIVKFILFCWRDIVKWRAQS